VHWGDPNAKSNYHASTDAAADAFADNNGDADTTKYSNPATTE
jgi:hypothetical protein